MNTKLPKQSEEALEIVMRAVSSALKKSSCKIKQQVKELNTHVLEFCVPNIMTNIKQHIGYVKDVNALAQLWKIPPIMQRGNRLEYNMGFINFN